MLTGAMKAPYAHITPVSSNQKTGAIPVTTTEQDTCPPACPLRLSCYAKSGPLALHWAAVSRHDRGLPWGEFLPALTETLRKTFAPVWRHNQAGDLPGKGNRIDRALLMSLVRAATAPGIKARGFTYTHKPCVPGAGVPASTARANLQAVQSALADGFTVNLSADTLAHADALAATGMPVCVTVPEETPETFRTPGGLKGVVCPAQTREGVTCATCRLCSNPRRTVLVGFRYHGTRAGIMAEEIKQHRG